MLSDAAIFFSNQFIFAKGHRTFHLPHTIAATTVAHLSAILIRNYVNPVQTSFLAVCRGNLFDRSASQALPLCPYDAMH